MKRQANFACAAGVADPGRRRFIGGAAAAALITAAVPVMAADGPQLTVWKNPNCGCCGYWVDHLRQNGFTVSVIETAAMQPVKDQQGVPPELHSCHTAEVDGYAIEGHVPAHAIGRLLAARPAGRGLAVPGMPIGSPGMEGGTPEVYEVWLFGDGAPRRFGRYLGDKAV
jgi:hypothetical protein